MKVLLIHQNFPGQFKHLAQQPSVEVLAIGRDTAPGLQGLRLLRYKSHRLANAGTHLYVRTFELVNFFDSAKLSEALITALNNKSGLSVCPQNVRRSAQQFSLKQGLNSYQQLIVGNSLGKKVRPTSPVVLINTA